MLREPRAVLTAMPQGIAQISGIDNEGLCW
jgi:hypothetical protein